jgi:hypothetical protein
MTAAASRRGRRLIGHTIAHRSALTAAALVALLLLVPVSGIAQVADEPFARGGWHLELAGTGVLETWNYNLNHEEIFGPYAGLTYGVGKGIVLMLGWPLYHVSQRGTDGLLFGCTWGARGRIAQLGRVSTFWEVDVGVSHSDTVLPPRGTRFNYLAEGSVGTTIRLRRGVHVLTALKWIHVSNASLAGRDRNPDIEAVGLKTGVLLAF